MKELKELKGWLEYQLSKDSFFPMLAKVISKDAGCKEHHDGILAGFKITLAKIKELEKKVGGRK